MKQYIRKQKHPTVNLISTVRTHKSHISPANKWHLELINMKALTFINNEGLISSGEPGPEQHLIPQQGRNVRQHPSSYWTSQSEARSEGEKEFFRGDKSSEDVENKSVYQAMCCPHRTAHFKCGRSANPGWVLTVTHASADSEIFTHQQLRW